MEVSAMTSAASRERGDRANEFVWIPGSWVPQGDETFEDLALTILMAAFEYALDSANDASADHMANDLFDALTADGIVLSDRETSVVVCRERYDILVNAAEDALNDARHELTQWRADDDRTRLQQWVDKLDAALRAGSDTP